MPERPGFLLVAALLPGLVVLSGLAGCGDDDDDQPPQADIVHPRPGDLLTVAPDSILVLASDDRGVRRVEISLDDRLLSVDREAPYTTRLPLGLYADGRPHVLRARAYDSRSQAGSATPVTIAIDPSLQTVPQPTSLEPAVGDPQQVRLAWLPWPRPLEHFAWEAAHDDLFTTVAAAGTSADTVALVPLPADGLVYARVRAVQDEAPSDWSRTVRHSGLETWRTRFALPGRQLATALFVQPDGGLLLLSGGAAGHPVGRAAVQVVTATAAGDLLAAVDLLDSSHLPTDVQPTADGALVVAGRRDGGDHFLAAGDEDGLAWTVQPSIMAPTALVAAGPGQILAAGADLRPQMPADGGGLLASVGPGGELTPAGVFPLASGREVLRAWTRPDGGFVLAGSEGEPGGVWLLGLAPAVDGAHAVLWNVRLGSGDRWLLCGAGDDGLGNYVVAGAARLDRITMRYGWLAGFDQDGRVRWQVTDRAWQQFSGVAPAAGGRWVAVGAQRRDLGDQRYEFRTALRGLSSFGATLWEAVHRAGGDAQARAVAAHPGGGWYAAGALLVAGGDYDVDLLRVDDRGDLP